MLASAPSRSRLLLGALVLLTLVCGCESAPLTEDVNDDGRRLVLLLDSSTSMKTNDPDGNATLGVELLLGLAGSEDNVGIITYARSADTQVPLGRVGGAARRKAALKVLAQVERQGMTNFGLALDRAWEMLEAAQAPKGSAVVLLTDGISYQGPASFRRLRMRGPTVEEAVEAMETRGWRVFAIALGQEAANPFLTELVARTGGAVYPAPSADGLLAAFQRVAVEILGYSVAERGSRQVAVGPDTGRLAFLLPQPQSSPTLTHDGQPVGDSRVVTTSGAGASVVLLERPEPGSWSVDGDVGEVLALVESPFQLEFVPDRPAAKLQAGGREVLAVRLVARGELPQVQLRASLALADAPWGASFPLEATAEPARLEATFTVPQAKEPTPMRLRVEAVVSEGGRSFTVQRTRSYVVVPEKGGTKAPLPLALSISPNPVRRSHWSDAKPKSVAVQVVGDPTRAVELRCGDRTLSVSAGGRGSLTELEGDGPLKITAQAKDGSTWSRSVPIHTTRYAFKGSRSVRLPDTLPGETTRPVSFDVGIQPAERVDVEAGSLRGPGGARVELLIEGGRLRADLASTLVPGRYQGVLRVSVPDVPDLSVREVPVSLRVLKPKVRPRPKTITLATVTLRGSRGWAQTTFQVPSRHAEAELRADPLLRSAGDRIDPRLDVRLVRDAERPRQYELRVHLGSDLAPGTYEGKLSGPQLHVPVRVVVQRSRPTLPDAPAKAGPGGRAQGVTLVVDRSASMAQADPEGRGLRLLALLALGVRQGEPFVVVPSSGGAFEADALPLFVRRVLAAKPDARGGADLVRALSTARERTSPRGRVLLYTDDDLDVVAANGDVPSEVLDRAEASPTRSDLQGIARDLLPQLKQPPLALRAPADRQAPFLESLGAQVVDLARDEDAVVDRLQRALWTEPRFVRATKQLPVSARAVVFSRAEVPGLVSVGDGVWAGTLPSGPLDLPPGARGWVAPAPNPPQATAYVLLDGWLRVVSQGPVSGRLLARRGSKVVELKGSPAVGDLPRGEGQVLVQRVVALESRDLIAGERRVDPQPALLVLIASGSPRVGSRLELACEPPPGLVPGAFSIQVSQGAAAPIDVQLQPQGGRFVGEFTPPRIGVIKVTSDRFDLELAPLVIEGAPKATTGSDDTTPQPASSTPAASTPTVDQPEKPWRFIGGGLLAVALIWLGVSLVRRRRRLVFLRQIGERQLRALTSRGRVSPERYLFSDFLQRDGTVPIVPEEAPGAVLLTLRSEGNVLCEAQRGARVVHPDRPRVLADSLVLDHRDVFALIHGTEALRYVYLDAEPTAEELQMQFVADDDSAAEHMGDSERLVLIDDDMNVSHASGRLDASTVAVFPESSEDLTDSSEDRLVVPPDEPSAESERLLIVDSAEEELLASQEVELIDPPSRDPDA